ncbi:UNVERIFIED_CONTAM: Acyl-CoA-binding protein [Sesamum angustifolium]|uniref:Acyl-CoA-binding protein n=1 Tax=Sesamum angustifolium TaxID=2727405 RepID=A0AAW2K9M7_9LAMI
MSVLLLSHVFADLEGIAALIDGIGKDGVFGVGSEEFEEHCAKAKTLPQNTTNENLLILYGLFKQATVGKINTSRPGMFNMKDRAKWDAWKAVEGKSQDEAMGDYITKVKQLLEEAAASS